jgi:hypothetical protein
MSEIAVATRCTICNRKFYGPRGPTVVGEQPAGRMAHFVQQLGQHIAQAHPEQSQVMMLRIWEFQGWLLLSLFDTDDPKVSDQRDRFRWLIHQATLRCKAENLDLKAAEVANQLIHWIVNGGDRDLEVIRSLTTDLCLSALQELRNITEEPDLYPTIQAEPTPKIEV